MNKIEEASVFTSSREKKMVARLAYRYAIAAAGVAVLVFAVTFLPLYVRLENEVGQRFNLNHKLEKTRVDIYFRYMEEVANQVSTRTQARKLLIVYNQGTAKREMAAKELQKILEDAISASPNLIHISRLGADGTLIAQAGLPLPPQFLQEKDHPGPGPQGSIHTHWRFTPAGRPIFFVHSPILNGQGQRIGTDLVAFSMEPIRKLLLEYRDFGASYRAYLCFEEQGTMHSVFSEEDPEVAALFKKRDTITGKETLQDTEGAITDDVILRSSPATAEGLVFLTSAKKREAFSPIRSLAFLLLFSTMAVAAAGLLMVWRFSSPIRRKLLEAMDDNARMSERLTQESKRFRDSINFSPVPVALTDGSGAILFLNRKFTEIFGYTGEELPAIDAWWSKAYPDPAYRVRVKGEWDRRIDETLRTGFEFPAQEADVTCKNGSIRTISFRFAMLGEMGMTVFYDITERKQMEAQLSDLNKNLEKRVLEEVAKRQEQERLMLQQSRLAMMGEMISMIAHQWRQPLNFLGLMVQEIIDAKEYGELDDTHLEEVTASAMKTVVRMSETIDDFRNFFSPEKKKILFSVQEAIRDSVEMIAPSLKHNNIELDLQIAEDVEIVGFRNEFSQVILNLISNAKDAIKIREPAIRKITIAVEKPAAGKAKVIVSDTGGGIPADILPSIFDPYFSTKLRSEGTGIGLYMSKMIIEKNMGGNLTAINSDSGAEFIIEL